MPKFSNLLTATICLSFVAACSQTEAPAPIRPEPVYNKYGDVVGCTDGSIVAGSTAVNPCNYVPPPPDGCDETATPGTAAIPCPPTGEGRDPDDSSTSGGGRTPGSSSTPRGGSSTPGTPPGSTP